MYTLQSLPFINYPKLVMGLKFQAEIDKFNLVDCPSNVSVPEKDIKAYRFSFEPIEHEYNFLPNVLIDRIKNVPFNFNLCSPEKKCLRCGSSFFLSSESALSKWNKLPIQFKENYGYTHLASGTINKEDGFISIPQNNHFTFYQKEDVQLEKKFKNITKL